MAAPTIAIVATEPGTITDGDMVAYNVNESTFVSGDSSAMEDCFFFWRVTARNTTTLDDWEDYRRRVAHPHLSSGTGLVSISGTDISVNVDLAGGPPSPSTTAEYVTRNRVHGFGINYTLAEGDWTISLTCTNPSGDSTTVTRDITVAAASTGKTEQTLQASGGDHSTWNSGIAWLLGGANRTLIVENGFDGQYTGATSPDLSSGGQRIVTADPSGTRAVLEMATDDDGGVTMSSDYCAIVGVDIRPESGGGIREGVAILIKDCTGSYISNVEVLGDPFTPGDCYWQSVTVEAQGSDIGSAMVLNCDLAGSRVSGQYTLGPRAHAGRNLRRLFACGGTYKGSTNESIIRHLLDGNQEFNGFWYLTLDNSDVQLKSCLRNSKCSYMHALGLLAIDGGISVGQTGSGTQNPSVITMDSVAFTGVSSAANIGIGRGANRVRFRNCISEGNIGLGVSEQVESQPNTDIRVYHCTATGDIAMGGITSGGEFIDGCHIKGCLGQRGRRNPDATNTDIDDNQWEQVNDYDDGSRTIEQWNAYADVGTDTLGDWSINSGFYPTAAVRTISKLPECPMDFYGRNRAATTSVGATEPAMASIGSPTVTDIETDAATLGANVTALNLGTVIERGVVVSEAATNNNPEIGGTGVTKIVGTGTTGVFTVSATSLTDNTEHAFKGFVTTDAGTTYTAQSGFFTLSDTPAEYIEATVQIDPDSDLTAPVQHIDLSSVPTAFWQAIDTTDFTKGRAYLSDGTTRLACDWHPDQLDTGNNTGWLTVRWSGTLASGGSNTIRIYPPIDSNSGVADDAAFGRDAVYADNIDYATLTEDDLVDRTGNNAAATASGPTPGGLAGKVGLATAFNGTTDRIVTPLDLIGLSTFTIAGWMLSTKVSPTGENGRSVVLSQASASGNRIARLGTNATGSIAYAWAQVNGGDATINTLSDDVCDGEWHHLALVADGTDLILYADGAEVDRAAFTASLTGSSVDTLIGNQGFPSGGSAAPDGALNDIQVHHTARSVEWLDNYYDNTVDNSAYWGTWTTEFADTAPTVGSATSADITKTTATLGGNIFADGGDTITERGIVISETATEANPEIGDAGVTKVVASGTATGVFTTGVTGLTAGTQYSFRAYATNGVGTGYSAVGTFTTESLATLEIRDDEGGFPDDPEVINVTQSGTPGTWTRRVYARNAAWDTSLDNVGAGISSIGSITSSTESDGTTPFTIGSDTLAEDDYIIINGEFDYSTAGSFSTVTLTITGGDGADNSPTSVWNITVSPSPQPTPTGGSRSRDRSRLR